MRLSGRALCRIWAAGAKSASGVTVPRDRGATVAREGVRLDPLVGIELLRSLVTRMTLGVGANAAPNRFELQWPSAFDYDPA